MNASAPTVAREESIACLNDRRRLGLDRTARTVIARALPPSPCRATPAIGYQLQVNQARKVLLETKAVKGN
jgi:hypothetical protein